MKARYKIIIFFVAILISNNLFAQSVHSYNIVKQTQGINGILRATANANSNAKIHANSNSVFVTGKTKPNYKDQPRKDEVKVDVEIKKNGKVKKQKK